MDELFDKILFRALKKNATDIHLFLKDELVIKFRVLGDLTIYQKIERGMGEKLMNYIKYKASINTNYRFLPQTGRFSIVVSKKKYDLRISYLPSTEFESIVIRILNNHDIMTIEQLTYQQDVQDYLYWLTKQKSGLFLISGATGSGKSTTLYTVLKEIVRSHHLNVITIEDPIEIHLEDCLQIEVNEKLNINYHDTLKQILRHDPDVIMIGEIRDEQTAKIAITCALTGHLVLSTIHASNAVLSLKRMINLGVSEMDLEDVALGVMSQRMKYDKVNKKAFVLSECLSRSQIKDYFCSGHIQYRTFKEEAQTLIENGFSQDLFEGELL